MGSGDVTQSVTRIDEYQTMRVGLDQQAVAYEVAQQPGAASVK